MDVDDLAPDGCIDLGGLAGERVWYRPPVGQSPDAALDDARHAFVTDRITLDEFEDRVEAALGRVSDA